MKKESENAVDMKRNADGIKQNNKREKKFQCTKTGFERCAMQITIAIKVPYHQLGRTRSFDYVASGSTCKTFSEYMTLNNMNKEEKSQNAVDTKQNTYGMKLNNKREKSSSSESISIALKPLLMLRALPLSIKHTPSFDLRGKWSRCKTFSEFMMLNSC
ncbi:hypothetical protein T12_14644 [Trichinella patagoniensis]|uniref:Uncharacterized protein n=1 Tax=Trichinella patagoniensis TaxID=990121 RepID=A0A0V0ZWH2_9BILA|nr:hypothetical protein T12_14644 [Trichinella patagoniensis]